MIEDNKPKTTEIVTNTKEPYKHEIVNNKKIAAGVLAILLGPLGVHKFVLGYIGEGVLVIIGSILITVFTCGMGARIPFLLTLIEGIVYLTKTDEEFYRTYQLNKRPWF